MNDEKFMVPVDQAIDPTKSFRSTAYDEWYNGPDDLEDYGLGEDCHGYSCTDCP